jgi:hypothetical protein
MRGAFDVPANEIPSLDGELQSSKRDKRSWTTTQHEHTSITHPSHGFYKLQETAERIRRCPRIGSSRIPNWNDYATANIAALAQLLARLIFVMLARVVSALGDHIMLERRSNWFHHHRFPTP